MLQLSKGTYKALPLCYQAKRIIPYQPLSTFAQQIRLNTTQIQVATTPVFKSSINQVDHSIQPNQLNQLNQPNLSILNIKLLNKYLNYFINQSRNMFPHRKVSVQDNTGGEQGFDPRMKLSAFAVLFAINTIVFIIIFSDERKQGRPKKWVEDHLMVTANNIKQHRYYTLLTSAFTHPNIMD